MGVFHVLGPCVVCRVIFFFNPIKVPSIRVQGVREPVCEACLGRFNAQRKATGLPPVEALPGAYAPVDEIDWVTDSGDF